MEYGYVEPFPFLITGLRLLCFIRFAAATALRTSINAAPNSKHTFIMGTTTTTRYSLPSFWELGGGGTAEDRGREQPKRKNNS